MIASGGSFVGISSIAAIQVPGESVAYAVSKAGLSMLVRTIARDFAADGVRANVVCPGWVRTEMADQEMAELGEVIGADVGARGFPFGAAGIAHPRAPRLAIRAGAERAQHVGVEQGVGHARLSQGRCHAVGH